MSEKPSTVFERQIERIHQLLEREPARVTWNERIPDPDNPEQLRQVDITIDRDGTIVHAECRLHQAPQDVQWIEELIGRRVSLGADVMIAVSSSGFTTGAVRKAAAHNIHLRTLSELTDDEITLWANTAKAWLVFYEFTDCRLRIEMCCEPPVEEPWISKEDGSAVEWRGMFEPLMTEFDGKPELDNGRAIFEVDIGAPILVNGQKPIKLTLAATVRRLKQPVPLDAMLRYAATDSSVDAIARVQKHADEIIEIIQSSDEVAFVTDSTNLVVPPDAFFHTIEMDFMRPIILRWVKVVSPQFAMQSNVEVRAHIRYRRPDLDLTSSGTDDNEK
ncbi:restriction endonuclease [Bradyrhizobium oligotrophicum]|uniref:restriction endonuclease n=1 Tax=Bradyrhizobium oligotrophicum TaxID=44255 RepID=UPI003EBCCEE7